LYTFLGAILHMEGIMHRRNFFLTAGAAGALLTSAAGAQKAPLNAKEAKAELLKLAAFFEKRPKAGAALLAFAQSWSSALYPDDDPPYCGNGVRVIFNPVFPPRLNTDKWIDAIEVLGKDYKKLSMAEMIKRVANSSMVSPSVAISFNRAGAPIMTR
jgi:hypothetical protein